MSALDKPIVVLGAARSGTKLLPGVFNKQPQVAYWSEPNYVWRTGNARMTHDMIPASRATAPVRRRIRERFAEHVAKENGERFCEKTPANTLRLPFVLNVLPDAKVVHIVRDGRDVALSARMRWRGDISRFWVEEVGREQPGFAMLRRRFVKRIKEVDWRELPYYIPRQLKNMFKRASGAQQLWGPRFPGIRELVRTHSLLEVCALQWRFSVDGVLNCVAANEEVAYHEVKYEDLCRQPEKHLREIFEFVEITPVQSLTDLSDGIKSGNTRKWEEKMSRDERERLAPHISHTLERLGYPSHSRT